MKKKLRWLLCGLAWISQVKAQTAVPAGAGSYASFPPAAQATGGTGNFINDQPIYVADNKKNLPIPTNDWWTDLIVNGKNAGSLWAYPLVLDPDPHGLKLFFPTKLISQGTGMNMDYGGGITFGADGYEPNTAVAKEWTDWGLVISMPDSTGKKNMEVTSAHGVPFTWIETKGIDPRFTFDKSASYLTADGSPVQFPTNRSFVISTDGRYFGVHLDGQHMAEIQGQQFVQIDLGSQQHISRLVLNWENAFASGYSIQVSDDKINWRTIYTTFQGDGATDDFNVNGSGRYVKLALAEKGTIFGFSLFEMKVFNGETLVSQGKPVEVSSTQAPWAKEGVNDGDPNTRWASDMNQKEQLVLNTGLVDAFLALSALSGPSDLPYFDNFAFNKVTDTRFRYNYDSKGGKIQVNWDLTTKNLKGQADGATLQGFLPHLYADADHQISFTRYSYTTNHGALKLAEGNSFGFTYDFGGILSSYNAPYKDVTDKTPYDARIMFDQITKFSKRSDFGDDTYYGGKDLVNFAKYTLMAKELKHQAFGSLKAKTRQRLIDWLTYTPGEASHYFAAYERWKGLVGFNPSFDSYNFTDNHFHYGYFTLACAMYGMVDPDFLDQYGPMIRLIAKQYANWDRNDPAFPFLRTFDPWIGHSYAGGISSSNGNNQESSSEAMQSWIGLFLLGDMLNDDGMRQAGAYGYTSESYATLEYWFDWKRRNFPPDFGYKMAAIVSNQGSGHLTYFGDRPIYVHGIQYLPITPGFRYLARDTAWAQSEYADLMQETQQREGSANEAAFGQDWAHVALGYRQLFDPAYSAAFMSKNLTLPVNDPNYIMNEKTAGITYFYTHADQNLGTFSFKYHTDFPQSSVFERNGTFSHAVAYNPTSSEKTCTIYDLSGKAAGSFSVGPHEMATYPQLPDEGNKPEGCYGVSPVKAYASSGNPQAAIDGDIGSRWESKFEDPQYLVVDLGIITKVNKVTLTWERASAKDYNILASTDSLKWDTIAVKKDMPATEGNRVDLIDSIGHNYRFLKMDGRSRTTPYGYSLFEFEICGTAVEDTVLTAVKLPAMIQAEDFTSMSGVQTETNNDAGGGQDVGYIDAGDWMEYRVKAPRSGLYQFKLRVASPVDTGKLELYSDGVPLGAVIIPNTGAWQTYRSVTLSVKLKEGEQTLRILASGPFNINWLDITNGDTGAGTHIEAENYSAQSGIQTEPANDYAGGLDVGYIDPQDWLEYPVNIPAPGTYTVKYRIASPYDSGIIRLSAGSTVLGTTGIPDTKGYQNWATVTATATFTMAGQQTIRLTALGGNFNINWLEINDDQNSALSASARSFFDKPAVFNDGRQPGAPDIIVHQAVSPNGDGISDFLLIEGIEKYTQNKIIIIDLNGVKVFETSNYDNISHVFSGRSSFTGRLQRPGTYFYQLQYLREGKMINKTGYLLLKY